MKKIITFFLLSLFTIACSSSNEHEIKSETPPPSIDSNIVLSIVNTNGDKLITNGTINRDEVSIEYKKEDVFVPAESSFCNSDQSDVLLFSDVHKFMAKQGRITNFKLTFPNQQVYYIDVELDSIPPTSSGNIKVFIKKVYVNNEMIYEGNESASGNKCSGFLMFDLIINE